MDHRSWYGLSYLPLRVMKKATEKFVKYGTTEAMTARRDHYGPSRGPLTEMHFDRFSALSVFLLLDFCFINSCKNLIYGVRLPYG